ncbi:MAG: hypothetical protein Aurels2KO_27090 [Aureliella sp.]
MEALEGRYPFFSRWEGQLGWPPNFNLDPLNGHAWPTGKSWLDTARSGPPRDDIKLVWEASRFTLAFYLAREFARTGDERWAEAFWEMLDAWVEQNPVNESVAWACGQETAFRLFAILLAAFATLNSSAATEPRLSKLELLCWQFGKRIRANINYALSQENNHGISEAVGLWTVGLLFPEFRESKQWIMTGEKHLVGEVERQVYADGSFVQHSMSYHRVMLDDLCWYAALCQANGRRMDSLVMNRGRAATDWLSNIVDTRNGRVPNYGSNDGANVLPLSCSDYLDYRPTLQCSAQLFDVPVGLNRGEWDEKTLWMTGRFPIQAARQQDTHWQARAGGYFLLNGPNSRSFVRATTYRDRPCQCDMLHLDLWYRGHNILRDAGSYFYYHKDKSVKDYFYSVRAHNTASIDGVEQMTKGPNFLWFHWPPGEAHFEGANRLCCRAKFSVGKKFEHRRTVDRVGDCYTVADSIDTAEAFTVTWRLAPELIWVRSGDSGFQTEIDGEPFVVRFQGLGGGVIHESTAFESLYYGERSEVPMVQVRGAYSEVVTQIGPTPLRQGN